MNLLPKTFTRNQSSESDLNAAAMIAEAEDRGVVGKRTRKKILEKKKATESIIQAADLVIDHLSDFPHLLHFRRNGLSVHLKSGRGDKLKIHTKTYLKNLLRLNMEGPYGSGWPAEEKIKRREMISRDAHYVLVHEISDEDATGQEGIGTCDGPLIGFVHYRFILEEEVPVVYVYELQLEPRVQGKGLGQFLMQMIELIGHKNAMAAVMLTVQKANLSAMKFYIDKLRYGISAISPSQFGIEKNYEILCKTFSEEAQPVREVS